VDLEPEWDASLAASFTEAGNVIAGEEEPGTTAPELGQALLAIGSLRMRSVGRDRTPRFVPVISDNGGAVWPLSIIAAQQYAKLAHADPPPAWSFRSPGFWIDFLRKPSYFPAFSYAEVFNAVEGRILDAQRTPLSIFSGRIALIGLDDPTSLRDYFTLPNSLGGMYPGVFVHAYAMETIFRGRSVVRAGPWADAGICLLVIMGLLGILELRFPRVRAAVLVLLPIITFCLALALLMTERFWLGYAPIFVSFWMVLLLDRLHGRLLLAVSLRRAFGFDPRLLESFRKESARVGGPVRREAAILIADVRNYTAWVSGTDPVQVSKVMSDFLAAMEHCITGSGGYINKYVGDQIIAVFGFPLDCSHCAPRAVRAGLAMRKELGRLKNSWRERGLIGIERMGVSIDTGTVTFTELGGQTKSQFDIIGDCVNGASRIEHLTKELKRDFLISEEAYHALQVDDRLSGSFTFLKNAAIRGQGRRKVYALIRED
jgi:class 3 adenylate cyclase